MKSSSVTFSTGSYTLKAVCHSMRLGAQSHNYPSTGAGPRKPKKYVARHTTTRVRSLALAGA